MPSENGEGVIVGGRSQGSLRVGVRNRGLLESVRVDGVQYFDHGCRL